jgi:hypothetical protein
MQASDYKNSRFLYFKEDAIRKPPHAGATKSAIHQWKLQWAFSDSLDALVYRVSKALT